MRWTGLRFRDHPACTVSAGIVAVLYWISVWGTYAWAESHVSGLGYEAIPFLVFSWPWSALFYGVCSQIPNHETAWLTYAAICIFLSGVNAVILFLAIYVVLSGLFDRWLGA